MSEEAGVFNGCYETLSSVVWVSFRPLCSRQCAVAFISLLLFLSRAFLALLLLGRRLRHNVLELRPQAFDLAELVADLSLISMLPRGSLVFGFGPARIRQSLLQGSDSACSYSEEHSPCPAPRSAPFTRLVLARAVRGTHGRDIPDQDLSLLLKVRLLARWAIGSG